MDNINLPHSSSYEIAGRRKRQFWWQILLPVILTAIIVGTLAVLSTRASNPQITQWGNISTMVIVLPVLLSCMVALVLMGAIIFGLGRLLKVLPHFFLLARYRFYQLELAVRRVADKAAAPVIKTNSTAAAVRRVFRRDEDRTA